MKPPNPSGLCMCGCLQKTRIARQSYSDRGWVKGHPIPFIHNHQTRIEIKYLVEDRGYKTPCWVWRCPLDKDGYAQVTVDNRRCRAHKVYYEKAKGPVPDGLDLDHLCRVRHCVNPDHLEPVTNLENTRRGLNCKLGPADIPVIRSLHASGKSNAEIGDMFGVNRATIYLIATGKNWKGL
jgi:hypothetical protein